MAKDRKCLCCGKTYRYCPSCSRVDALKPAWHATFCCEECKALWETATKFNMGKLTKEEAKQIISSISLKDKSEYVECIQRDLGNILAEDPKPKRVKRAKVQDIVEVTEEDVETSTNDPNEVVESE